METINIEYVDKPIIVEKLVEVEKIKEIMVPTERIVEVERIKEVPMITERIRIVEKPVEVPIEVIRIEEVEKIVYRDRFITKEDDCECLSGIRFVDVWNKMMHIEGPASTECITEDEFVTLL